MAKKKARQAKTVPADPRHALAELVGSSEILFIRLEGCIAERESAPAEQVSEPKKAVLNITLGSNYEDREGRPARLNFRVTIEAAASLRSNGPAVTVRANYLVVYTLRPGTPQPDEATVDAFGQEVAMFAVWPFWRELAQSLTVRMHLPPLPVPLLRRETLVQWKPQEQETATEP